MQRNARTRLVDRIVTFIAVASISWGSSAAAQTAGAPTEKKAESEKNDRRTVRRLPANLGAGVVGVLHRDSLLPLFVGGVATGGASVLDQDMRDWINPTPGEGWGKTLETAGNGVWTSVFVAGMFTAGRISKDTRFRAFSYDLLDASVVNVAYSSALKAIVKRERPNGVDNKSFPSGHTSSAFTLATVAERHYGWKVGIPAYLIAGTIGASRMKQDAHYFSDVVAGATLGYIVGRTVVRVNSRPLGDSSHKGALLNLAPMVSPRARGLQMSLTF